jgi:hypothetical protein
MYCLFCVVLCTVCFVLFCVLFVLCRPVYCLFCVVLCTLCFVSFYVLFVCVVLCTVCFVLFYVLFVCLCVLYYCHRVATQLQLTNISICWRKVFFLNAAFAMEIVDLISHVHRAPFIMLTKQLKYSTFSRCF